MPSSPSLATRALLTIGLMAGFYALAFSLAAGLLFVPYADLRDTHSLHLKLDLFCLIGAGTILWSIVPRLDRFLPPGPSLSPQQQPRLFQKLTEVARATGEEMPAEVYLTPEVNAWVAQRGGVMGFGSRRVMGLGLPLLQLLRVTQLQAVLTHEFGHYYGGDTRLGPWIYKTRAAIGRTLQNLSGRSSLLQTPFLWYGNLALRITHGVSRQQEFAADALAARTVGSRPLAEALQTIHGAAAAFDCYVEHEVAPLLGRGYRPPLAEGFARFVSVPQIAAAIAQVTARALAEGKADPFDTHPPLRERVAALECLPDGAAPAGDPCVFTLLDAPSELEARMLSMLTGKNATALKPVEWEETGEGIYLPEWRRLIQPHTATLLGIAPGALPELAKAPTEFGGKLLLAGQLPPPEELPNRAVAVLGAALAVALDAHGWILRTGPGEPIRFARDQVSIEPFRVVSQLANGQLDATAWQQQCAAWGIAELDLGSFATADHSTEAHLTRD